MFCFAPVKRLSGKIISEITSNVSSGMLIKLNSAELWCDSDVKLVTVSVVSSFHQMHNELCSFAVSQVNSAG